MKSKLNAVIGLLNIISQLNQEYTVFINGTEFQNPAKMWCEDDVVYIIKQNNNLICFDVDEIKIITMLKGGDNNDKNA